MKNLMWDTENKSIRGSFVNLFLTFTLLILICITVLSGNDKMVNSIKELQALIVWFYGISFGLWSGKKMVESVFTTKDTTIKTVNDKENN